MTRCHGRRCIWRDIRLRRSFAAFDRPRPVLKRGGELSSVPELGTVIRSKRRDQATQEACEWAGTAHCQTAANHIVRKGSGRAQAFHIQLHRLIHRRRHGFASRNERYLQRSRKGSQSGPQLARNDSYCGRYFQRMGIDISAGYCRAVSKGHRA
jgi:hypothetical protein